MTAAAAIIVRREREIVAVYRAAGATRAESARSPEDLDIHHRLVFDRLVRRAVLRQVSDGCYYLDEPSWTALRSMRQRFLIIAVLVVVLIFVVLIGTGVFAVKAGIPQLH